MQECGEGRPSKVSSMRWYVAGRHGRRPATRSASFRDLEPRHAAGSLAVRRLSRRESAQRATEQLQTPVVLVLQSVLCLGVAHNQHLLLRPDDMPAMEHHTFVIHHNRILVESRSFARTREATFANHRQAVTAGPLYLASSRDRHVTHRGKAKWCSPNNSSQSPNASHPGVHHA